MSGASLTRRAVPVVGLALLLGACGGSGGGNPVGPPTPPAETFSLSVVVYYDENANGLLDADELGRVPRATVTVAGRSAHTDMLTGQATLSGLPRGQASVAITGLPRFYVAPQALAVDLPASGELALPVTLPIGSNWPNRYLAFGDSITEGEGSGSDKGYRPLLEDRLRAHFGVGEVLVDAVSGSYSDEGAARLGRALSRLRPAYTLILYGTNDWYPCGDPASCFTLDALAAMVRSAKAANSLPVLATIPPVNAGYDARVPPSRNEFVAEQGRLIRDLAAAEGALLVDLEPAFYKAAGDDLSQLFSDHVHPNDQGYVVMADEFYKALSAPVESSSTSSAWSFAPPVAGGPADPSALGPAARPGLLGRPEWPHARLRRE